MSLTVAYAIVGIALGAVVIVGFTFASIWHRLPGD